MTRQDRSLIAGFRGILINALLCLAIGALVGGLPGGQIGLVVGICLSLLPGALRRLSSLLDRPTGMVRFLAREAAALCLRIAANIVAALVGVFSPLATAMRGPLLLGRFVGSLVAGLIGAALSRIGPLLATPLGLANVAALEHRAINLTHIPSA